MTTEVKIHITEDDLSERIKAKIKQLRKQGIDVEIIWPENYDPDKYNRLPYINITSEPAPINPINPIPLYPQDPVWPTRTSNETFYCTAPCTLN